ncbi:hypothetical protein GCM10009839_08170 [Catenulispora yoronensis]|uniref:Uncharacterized protein n=1 Tax=Catenulispora yoronensis TaxID=450799 RepID=A0ABN2TNC0_9ACTN
MAAVEHEFLPPPDPSEWLGDGLAVCPVDSPDSFGEVSQDRERTLTWDALRSARWFMSDPTTDYGP